jgi:hypothetical protein
MGAVVRLLDGLLNFEGLYYNPSRWRAVLGARGGGIEVVAVTAVTEIVTGDRGLLDHTQHSCHNRPYTRASDSGSRSRRVVTWFCHWLSLPSDSGGVG